MQIIQSVAPYLSVCLTNDNRLVIMVETDDGEQLAEVTDIDCLVQALRRVALVQTEMVQAECALTGPVFRPGSPVTSAEADLTRRASQ